MYYGAGAYGVEAAARTYFHKHASHLNLKEAALLAALPKFPSAYSPTTDKEMATEQRNKVLQLMADQGYVTQARADKLMASKLKVYKHPPSLNKSMADYFVDYVTRQLTKRYGSAMVFGGGLKVVTSIDLAWQQEAIDIIKSTTEPLDFGFKPSAALVAIDPENGYIRTMVGGLDYKKQKFNLAWQGKRQPGSAMKPFVLTAAVNKGMDPNSTYYSSKSPIIIPMGAFAAPWVVNGDGPGGPESVSAATTISDNVVFAQLSVDVGPEVTVEIAHKMGITSPLDAVPSITLGTSGVTPLEMADAYATLAANGIHHKPQAIVKVLLPDNGRYKVDWKPKTSGKRAIPAGVASVVTECLERVASGGTGSATGSYFPYPRAGKTGTTEDGADLWYCGYTPNLAAAVWMGDDEKRSAMPVYGGTYPRADVGQVLRGGAQGRGPPELQGLPVDVQPVGGQDAGHVAVGVGFAVGQRQRLAEPRPDQDHHAEAGADQDHRSADAAADADQDQAAQPGADADEHAQRRAQAGGRGDHDAHRPAELRRRRRHGGGHRQRRVRRGRRAGGLGRRPPRPLTL